MRVPKSADDWQKDIQARARRVFQYLYMPLGFAAGILIAIAYAIILYFPEGGTILGAVLSKNFVNTISFLLSILGVGSVVGTVWAILKRIEPAFRRYNDAAREVVDEVVRQLRLSNTTRRKMIEIVTSRLTSCTDPSLKNQCKTGLQQASAKLSNMVARCLYGQKSKLASQIVSEWDVVRRTAEFFDDKLGNLRTFALTTVLTLIGIAFQLKLSLLVFLASFLPVAFLFIDRRFQSYLKAVAEYAGQLEDKYRFSGNGLTRKIQEARQGQWMTIETMFMFVYLLVFVFGIILFLTMGSS